MAEAFIGEIRMFTGDFVPKGWAFCNGEILNINEFQSLFGVLGSKYGGDGKTTFALPDFRGRVPMSFNGDYPIGKSGGSEKVTLNESEMPSHYHSIYKSPVNGFLNVSNGSGNTSDPNQAKSIATSAGLNGMFSTNNPTQTIDCVMGTIESKGTGEAGGGQAHDNMQPYLTVNFIIATDGIFPL